MGPDTEVQAEAKKEVKEEEEDNNVTKKLVKCVRI